jgi:hypothetical protein
MLNFGTVHGDEKLLDEEALPTNQLLCHRKKIEIAFATVSQELFTARSTLLQLADKVMSLGWRCRGF